MGGAPPCREIHYVAPIYVRFRAVNGCVLTGGWQEWPMTPEQTEILAKLKEIQEQMDYLLAESADVPGLARSRVIHARNLSLHLQSIIGSSVLKLVKDGR